MKFQVLKTEGVYSGQNAHRTGRHTPHPGGGQADQRSSPSSEAQDTGRHLFGGSKE